MLPPGLQQRGAACRRLGLHLGRREGKPLVAGSVATPGGQAVGAAAGYCQEGISRRSAWKCGVSGVVSLQVVGVVTGVVELMD